MVKLFENWNFSNSGTRYTIICIFKTDLFHGNQPIVYFWDCFVNNSISSLSDFYLLFVVLCHVCGGETAKEKKTKEEKKKEGKKTFFFNYCFILFCFFFSFSFSFSFSSFLLLLLLLFSFFFSFFLFLFFYFFFIFFPFLLSFFFLLSDAFEKSIQTQNKTRDTCKCTISKVTITN